ncbi:hypothetical protein [uncultured Ruthenibacterium sp.]|uniref:hypothetical protein n=1 Tax=uncultured Ruthenibacterium sp. TaxID=1905347 RepID=UPI00349EDED4
MRYIMKSGILSISENAKKLAQVTSAFGKMKKTISLPDGSVQYQTDIDIMDAPAEKRGDVRYRVYTLTNGNDQVLMVAHPGYAKEDDPDMVAWPMCRTPKVDHADIMIDGVTYLLVMHNSQNYALKDGKGTSVLQIMHKGISGGWTIETAKSFSAQVICGLFIFCRYIEQENEFIIV